MDGWHHGLPTGFLQWPPAIQATALALSTLIQEDVPAVSAAWLTATGALGAPTGFLGVFLGIWGGDFLLYGFARGIGRRLVDRPWFRRFLEPTAVERSERWFAAQGTWVLVASRFVPGTRLPTYLAAGFLRLPVGRFLAVTGLAVAFWTGALFLLTQAIGPRVLRFLGTWGAEGSMRTAVVVATAILLLRGFRRWAPRFSRRRAAATLGRWRRWEFWPPWLFYLPVAAHYARLSVRHRGVTVPTAANPGFFTGGFVGESKVAILRDLGASSPEFTAEAYLVEGSYSGARLADLHRLCAEHDLAIPFVLKPDVGQRGAGVRLIRSFDQAAEYLHRVRAPVLVQRYAPGPREVGLFYYRHPGAARGRILGITEKIFPVLIGDGRHTIEELVWLDARARFQAKTYLRRLGAQRLRVLTPGEAFRLVEAGNHAQGCLFQDGWHLWSEPLEQRLDEISRRLPGFFIGRYDIRYASDEDLCSGKGFQIVELNGATSEVTSIYDPRHSLRAAYRTLFRQWELVFAIGAANRRLGTVPTPLRELWQAWRKTSALTATYPAAD